MVLVAEREYCDGAAGCSCGSGGAGQLVSETRHVDAATWHTTDFEYDWRGRQLKAFPPADDAGRTVYSQTTYDNLDRAVKQERYLEISGSADRLLARSETFYDDRGRVYQTKRYAVNVDTGAAGNSLVSNTWYDAAGHAIKQQPAGSQAFTKTVFDSLGRAVKQYVGYDTDETAYADASSVSDDTIVEQFEITYDDAGSVLQTTTRQRFHNATGTGELTTPSGSQPKARVTYAAMYHDEIGRQVAVANYGTCGGAAFSRASVVPSRTDTILVTSTEYDDAGQAYKTIDPAGREDRQVFDDAGRVTKTIQNYTDGVVNGSYPDEDVTVEMTYNADGNVKTLTAKNPTTGDQTTTYVYGTTLTDSEIATSTLKRAEIYPDSDDTPSLGDGSDGVFDRVEFCYNRQNQRTSKKDQNGSVHEYEYDALGRMLHDRVTMVGSGVDDAVRRISTTYDVRGQVENLSSYDNATVGSGNVVNQVVFEYDEHGLPVKEYQEHDGAKDANTPYVGYSYDTTASSGVLTKGLRPTSLRYPNGRLIHYTYGASGSTEDAMGRIAAINDDDSGSPGDALAEYGYLGTGSIVQVDYPEPDIRYDLAHGAGNDPYDGPMDRFGRVTDLLWRDYGGSADVVRIQHGYDRAGNRLWREDPVAGSYSKDFDELYAYDGMYQLVDMQRGNLNGTKDGLVANSKTFAENWSLDMTGNWSTYRQDEDGDGNWDLNQSRSHNGANEITEIAGNSSHVAHDRNGNMTKIPKPDDWSDHFDLTYDAWNRLVTVEDGEDLVAEYQYDARDFRVIKKLYDGGELDETRHFLYNRRWQCLEERVDSSTNADRQFVWGRRYIDDLVLRDRDTSEPKDGTLEERLYALQDPNWSVVVASDDAGAVQERFTYDIYGRPMVLTHIFANSPDLWEWDYWHTGLRFEHKAGLSDCRKRMRHLWLGRFTTRDPLPGTGVRHTQYEFAGNAPTQNLDPMGLLWTRHIVDTENGNTRGRLDVHTQLYSGRLQLAIRGQRNFDIVGDSGNTVTVSDSQIQAGATVEGIIAVDGMHFDSTFTVTRDRPDLKYCYYWKQYYRARGQVRVVSGSNDEILDESPSTWNLDKTSAELASRYRDPYIYQEWSNGGLSVKMTDEPGDVIDIRTGRRRHGTETTYTMEESLADAYQRAYGGYFDIVDQMQSTLGKDVRVYFRKCIYFQTYLCRKDGSPVGYIDWGFCNMPDRDTGRTAQVEKKMSWTYGFDAQVFH